MIELRHLTTGYGQKTVTCDINLNLHAGQLVALIGRNGVGKSTLLRTLCAFQSPLHGQLLIQGTDITQLNHSQLSQLISVVLTERTEVPNMTVYDMVAMGRSPYTGFFGRLSKADQEYIQQAIQQTGIQDLSNRNITTLSDGERQKVMIAKALAQQTPIILLDEPTAFLDYPSKAETLQLLSNLAHNAGKAILVSTHDVEMAIRLSDTLWLMNREGITVQTPEEFTQKGQLSTFFSMEQQITVNKC